MPGLGVLPGRVRRFVADSPDLKVPHIGWNRVEKHKGAPPSTASPAATSSTSCTPTTSEAIRERGGATTDYGGRVRLDRWRDNVFAVQFHPEKSQDVGLRLLAQLRRGWRGLDPDSI